MTIKGSAEKQCQWCSLFLGKEEYHDEFDFYKHPAAKITIRQLQEKSKGMDLEQYASSKKLKSERGVVMPAYGRLINAWKWMEHLEEKDRDIDASRPEQENTMSVADLPF